MLKTRCRLPRPRSRLDQGLAHPLALLDTAEGLGQRLGDPLAEEEKPKKPSVITADGA
jgi:hypothetical protein